MISQSDVSNLMLLSKSKTLKLVQQGATRMVRELEHVMLNERLNKRNFLTWREKS